MVFYKNLLNTETKSKKQRTKKQNLKTLRLQIEKYFFALNVD
jgi:hypothetical protein